MAFMYRTIIGIRYKLKILENCQNKCYENNINLNFLIFTKSSNNAFEQYIQLKFKPLPLKPLKVENKSFTYEVSVISETNCLLRIRIVLDRPEKDKLRTKILSPPAT